MTDETLSAEDRIRKVRITFLKEHPFFANISMYFNLMEEKGIETMGINAQGDLHYNSDFVKRYTFSELKMIIAHETLHMALLHLVRVGNRNKWLWNIATDLAINLLLKKEGFNVHSDFLLDHNYDGKCAEEIYDDLYKKAKKISKIIKDALGLEEVNCAGIHGKRFDSHYFPKMQNGNDAENKKHEDPNGKPMTDNEVKRLKDEWKKRITEAETIARQMGRMPAELERLFGTIIDSKINWKALLYRYVTQEIPFDSTYARPSKRSESTGVYMPYQLKENIDIVVGIDSSGSISDDEMTEFVSEMIGISKSFASIRMTVLVCDAEIHAVHEVVNGFGANEIKLAGGGGTDFRPVFKWIRENKPSTKLLVYLTDGYGEFPKSETTKTLWVLNNNCEVPFGEKIVFKGEG